MLKPEEAKKILEAMTSADNDRRILDLVAGLPEHLRTAAYAIKGRKPNRRPFAGHNWQQVAEAQEAAGRVLTQANAEERMSVFKCLFPNFPEHVEAGWQLLARLPYQLSYGRKAFRAPNSPDTLISSRLQFVVHLSLVASRYDKSITWYAAWAPYIGWYHHIFDTLFAAAIDSGTPEGNEVFDILTASARGEHEIGAMGRHVTGALLASTRRDGWEFVERLLLAAQREEGLRQVILESVDEAHPEAFRRMLQLVIDHDLARFSATVRAVDVWLGYMWDSAVGVRGINDTLSKLRTYLDDPDLAKEAIGDSALDAESVYLALWSIAFCDAFEAIPYASELLRDKKVERRFVGAHLLAQLGMAASHQELLTALEDEDLRVATRALNAVQGGSKKLEDTDLFERLERIYPRFPQKARQLEPLVWPWMSLTADRGTVAALMSHNLGKRSPKRLLPYLASLDTYFRGHVAELLAKNGSSDSETRDTLLMLVGDPSNWVRERALKAVEKFKLGDGEAVRLEKLLTRKASDLRRGILSLLLNQKDAEAAASAERLLASSDRLQRLAGLELVRKLVEAKRAVERCRELARAYSEKYTEPGGDEQPHIEAVLGRGTAAAPRKAWTLEDGLGLIERSKLTQPKEPRASFLEKLFQKPLVTPAAIECLRALDKLVHKHSTETIRVERYHETTDELLANVTWGLPEPERGVPAEEDAARLPLREVWEEWYRTRPSEMRDADGLELLRALAPMFRGSYWHVPVHLQQKTSKPPWHGKASRILYGDFELTQLAYPAIVKSVLVWMLKLHPPQRPVDMLLDGVEATVKLVPRGWMAEMMRNVHAVFNPWQGNDTWHGWLHLARHHRTESPTEWKNPHHVRLWELISWATGEANSAKPLLEEVLLAHRAGGASEEDILDVLIGPRPKHERHYYYSGRWEFPELYRLSSRKLPADAAEFAVVPELVEKCRRRILEVELERGDMPTAASGAAFALRWSGGLDMLVRLLRAMGKESLVRGWTYDSMSRAAVFSHLIRSTFPAEDDTRARFTEVMREAKIPQKRLLEVAMYAPQWAGHVEESVGWEGMAEGVWWIHAHTKDTGWSVDAEIKEGWTAQVSERTALSGQDLIDGAVDVAWFGRVYETLGEERWTGLYAAAQYAAGGGGHKRAQLFADAMLGRISQEELLKRIREKRNQDALRALGLLPLPDGEPDRERTVLERYETIQEFLRTSRKFGSQRQTSEKLAASISMQNLARTVGYPDPLRLEWAMEAQAIGDLASGPLTVTSEGVTVTLRINEWGESERTVEKGGKPLKAIPPKVKKLPEVAELMARERDVKRQTSRMRRSLEGAMCRGDRFTGAELRGFASHPVLWPMVEKLVFIGEDIAGYPVENGLALRDNEGKVHPLGKSEELRIAHPYDLIQRGQWHLWQHNLFRREEVQPFKQVFRELYVLTNAEREDGTISRRYAGHQVQPRQSLALLGGRGWVSHPEEGVRRTFHDLGVSAWISFLEGFYTPAEVDGLTIEGVHFTKRNDWKPLPLEDIQPRVFSEVMRDLDLVVSVAHRGSLDPEASASTVEMRASLLRETCEMLGLENVSLKEKHALVEGELGHYSVHLGSATVHRQPGGALCIVPVHSQHRGRLFLPFADDDPRTAEVVSKVLLLARDREIKDPTILEQLLVR
jgi:hypothetical protein